jgi:hypothetical protein
MELEVITWSYNLEGDLIEAAAGGAWQWTCRRKGIRAYRS